MVSSLLAQSDVWITKEEKKSKKRYKRPKIAAAQSKCVPGNVLEINNIT